MKRLTEAARGGFKQTQGEMDAAREDEREAAEIAEKMIIENE